MQNRQVTPCPTDRFWRVREGDTIFKIALQINSTVDAILELNPNINPQNLRVGQSICIPSPTPCPSGIFWVVSAGDTLFSIAQEVGTSVESLLELNLGINPNNLQIDQQICLPG
ncbi:MAG: peptidoglycan-binding protein [Desulfitibacter sp. BRH_c19]|nr:MAG: peptidoglycan-binding protein [Desulfitibacter sp. BRH_c19]